MAWNTRLDKKEKVNSAQNIHTFCFLAIVATW